MVQRYELSEEWGNPVMSEYDHGDWVSYEDYQNISAKAKMLADVIARFMGNERVDFYAALDAYGEVENDPRN